MALEGARPRSMPMYLDEEVVLAWATDARGCRTSLGAGLGKGAGAGSCLSSRPPSFVMDVRDICTSGAVYCDASPDWAG